MTIQPGQTILNGKYQILRLIGEGGMARVWLAEEPCFGNRQVAIKEPRTDLLPEHSQEVRQRYRREVQVCAALERARTPHIVRAITTELLGDTLLLVMEYMPGGDLAGMLKEHPEGLPVERAVAIALDLLAALERVHAHELEIVHRDVKPSNVLFDQQGRAHLADFGLAQLAGMSGRSQLAGTQHPGTPMYMAPEQARSVDMLLPAADLYSVGCILFEMLTGKRFKRVRPGTLPSALRSEVPDWLDEVVTRALTEDPWDRWPDALEMAAMIGEMEASARREAEERNRIDLSIKRPQPEPWALVEDKYELGQLVEGVVTNVVDFGAFAEIEPGIEGLIHVSELAEAPISHPKDVSKKGDLFLLRIIHIDARRKLLGLSLKRVLESEWSEWAARLAANDREKRSATKAITPADEVEEVGGAVEEPEAEAEEVLAEGEIPDWLRDLSPGEARAVVPTWQQIGMEMVTIPAGEFLYGEKKERVYLPEYALAKAPVTNVQYRAFVDTTGHEHPSHWEEGRISPGEENYPVAYVSWHDAQAFCEWAGCRLPTEQEWEKGARGTDGREYPWGDGWEEGRCNTSEEGFGGTTPVNSYPNGASPYGLLDMAGNVWEWCEDWYDSDSACKVLRGGSWDYSLKFARSAVRDRFDPDDPDPDFGFRCVVSP